jgi:hypothetical protein
VTVRQNSGAPSEKPPLGCAFSVSPASLSVGAGGGLAAVQIATGAGCAWSAASGAAWISIANLTSGEGSAQVQLSTTANAGPAREGSVTVAGRSITVAQAAGCTYAVAPRAQDIGASGGNAGVSVATASGCAWTAATSTEWITVQTRSGGGAGQMTFSVAANPGPPRSGAVTVAGETVAVNQASACTWTFAPPFASFDAGGGIGSVLVLVTGSCTWSVASNMEWIQLIGSTSGAGNGLFQFTVSSNSGAARTGSLTVAGQRYDVRQVGTR